MTEAKHTPGPWRTRASQDASGDIGITAPDVPNVIAECFADMRFVGEFAIVEAQANAHLIAAAPETTDALRSLLRLFEEIDGGENDDAPELVAARAALAKSQGK